MKYNLLLPMKKSLGIFVIRLWVKSKASNSCKCLNTFGLIFVIYNQIDNLRSIDLRFSLPFKAFSSNSVIWLPLKVNYTFDGK